MSSNKHKRSTRRFNAHRIIKKHQRVYRLTMGHAHKCPGKLRKHNGVNCGISGCVLCGNPRAIWGSLTMGERKVEITTMEQLTIGVGEG